ncbi:CPXCG motif-containing cysteine-rich protein [Luteimonas pelagia]
MFEACIVSCPYCGESFEALVDPGADDARYVEDCPVCCRPIEMALARDPTHPDGFALQTDRDD